MLTEKLTFQQAGKELAKGAWHLMQGIFIAMFGTLWDVIQSLRSDLLNAWTKRDGYAITGVFLAMILIGWITISTVLDIYGWVERRIHYSWHERQFLENYEGEVYEFFKLYSQKFSQRDCGFMRKVGIDEGMFDKWKNTEYGSDYSCENFYNGIKAKHFLPFEMEPMIESPEKRRIRGKMVVLRTMEDGQIFAGTQFFELWKAHDWDLWRFNASSKQGSTRIPLKLSSD